MYLKINLTILYVLCHIMWNMPQDKFTISIWISFSSLVCSYIQFICHSALVDCINLAIYHFFQVIQFFLECNCSQYSLVILCNPMALHGIFVSSLLCLILFEIVIFFSLGKIISQFCVYVQYIHNMYTHICFRHRIQ